jgi:hypothetical protein
MAALHNGFKVTVCFGDCLAKMFIKFGGKNGGSEPQRKK